jgi:UDP-2-acetamido-3-amino-2,3-dideoxy-glucuronate N-acetyltransferase
MAGIAVVGCGHWGKNLVRNFHQLDVLVAICDANETTRKTFETEYPGVQICSRYEDLLTNPDIDGIVISTPSHLHYAMAKAALFADKHVYVEKPVATRVEDAEEMVSLAKRLNKTLMVGHLLLYHPVVNRLKQLIDEGYLGEIRYIESDRLNHNPIRPDKSVIWDLGPHDLSMIMFILGQTPSKVLSVQGSQTGDDGIVDVAHIELEFPSGIRGHIHNSWVHPVKQVRLAVRGSKRSAIIDDTLPWPEKLKLSGSDPSEPLEEPEFLRIEPLKLECQHFLNCIETGRAPRTDGDNGLEVVRLLAEAETMLENLPNKQNKAESTSVSSQPGLF